MSSLAEASLARSEGLRFEELDKRLDLLLANISHGENPSDHYHAVTANPRSMGYLRFLLRYYAKFPHPWTKCFPADTPVDCPRDHEKHPDGVPISQLKRGDLVWSFNLDEYVFELKPVKWSSLMRRKAQLAMLTLDDGAQIKATPDHKFMRRDSSWAELQDLRPGDSLMPLYRDFLPMENCRICVNCGSEFDPTSGAQRHCSKSCRLKYNSRKPENKAAFYNHKVASVVLLDERQDVWDIEVEDNHSFVVRGVVAHNCMADNFKRFGPKTKGLCGVLKDTLRQSAMWRHGAPAGPHIGHPDAGSPGAAIGEADKWASPAWGGHKLSEDRRPLSLLDELDLEFGVVDHSEPLSDAAQIFCAIGAKCDIYRVLLGLDEGPKIDLSEVLA